MGVKIDTGASDVKRGEFYFVDPREVVADPALNGRWEPHDEASIVEMAESMLAQGQLQPAVVRKIPGSNRVQIVAGYRRHAAALWIVANRDENFRLKVTLSTLSDEDAFKANVTENRARKDCSPVDDATNQQRFRERYGWKDKDIATFFGISPSYVSQLKKLLTLPRATLARLHRREISVIAALELAATPAERTDTLDDLAGDGAGDAAGDAAPEPESSAAIIDRVRAERRAAGAKLKPNAREVRAFVAGLTEDGDLAPLGRALLAYLDGECSASEAESDLRDVVLGVE